MSTRLLNFGGSLLKFIMIVHYDFGSPKYEQKFSGQVILGPLGSAWYGLK